MAMTAFFSDLDRTLIFSHRIELPKEKLVVELLDGKEQSYMTCRTLAYLQSASWLRLIPVTMRSREQYERVTVFQTLLPCRYALICNGGVLLSDGEIDRAWLAETRRLASDELRELERAVKIFETLADRVRTPMDLMAYALCPDPEDTARHLRRAVDGSLLTVRADRGKLYCLPRSIHKGSALLRFRERFAVDTAVAAGDSAFDIPMLDAADYAIAPQTIAAQVRCANTIAAAGEGPFSDEICDVLETLRPRENFAGRDLQPCPDVLE